MSGLRPGAHPDNGQVLSHRLGPMPQGYGISNEAGLNLIFHPDTSHLEMDGSQCHKVRNSESWLVMPGEHPSLGGWLRRLLNPVRARGHHISAWITPGPVHTMNRVVFTLDDAIGT